MAKKNSTKTATKEAMQASEPKVQAFRQWAGININEVPSNWELMDDSTSQTDLNPKQLLIQNNVDTSTTGTLEVRNRERLVAIAPDGISMTGVTYMKGKYIYAAFSDKSIRRHSVVTPRDEWEEIKTNSKLEWTEIYSYINNEVEQLIALGTDSSGKHHLLSGPMSTCTTTGIKQAVEITDPTTAPTLTAIGSITGTSTNYVSRLQIAYAYSNEYGSTAVSNVSTFYTNLPVANFTYGKYLRVSGTAPTGRGIKGVDIYCSMNESTQLIFIGRAVPASNGNWQYNWFGSMANTDEWADANLVPDGYNTTGGPDARYCKQIDGRMYFWGSTDKPYRLYIGGNAGNELSLAQGLGGAYVDAEPGNGHVINSVLKWKTASGQSIVTVLCGNLNSSLSTRFNLLEHTITASNELAAKTYSFEQVANTVGCQSRWGAGVWSDGLYVLHRYGLTLTTHTMEYNSQVQSQIISDNIEPIFTDQMAWMIDNARMINIKDRVYICFGTSENTLDNMVIVYDIGLKAFYTYTYGNDKTDILHIMNIDYKGQVEGLGLIMPDKVVIIPTTGSYDYDDAHNVDIIIESGELSTSTPTQATSYLAQLEFRFDYFVGNVDVDIEGIDYYGRHVRVHKHINRHVLTNEFTDWVRVNYYMENYRIKIKGQAQFRLTHILAKLYTQSNKIGLTRGFDSRAFYYNRQNAAVDTRHYVRDYANLRDCIMP